MKNTLVAISENQLAKIVGGTLDCLGLIKKAMEECTALSPWLSSVTLADLQPYKINRAEELLHQGLEARKGLYIVNGLINNSDTPVPESENACNDVLKSVFENSVANLVWEIATHDLWMNGLQDADPEVQVKYFEEQVRQFIV